MFTELPSLIFNARETVNTNIYLYCLIKNIMTHVTRLQALRSSLLCVPDKGSKHKTCRNQIHMDLTTNIHGSYIAYEDTAKII